MPTQHPLPLLQGEREREPALESPTRSGALCTRTRTRMHTYVRVTLSPVSAGLCSAPGEGCGFSKGQARHFSVKGQMANTAGITGHMVPAGTTQAGPRSVNAGQYVAERAEPCSSVTWQIWPPSKSKCGGGSWWDWLRRFFVHRGETPTSSPQGRGDKQGGACGVVSGPQCSAASASRSGDGVNFGFRVLALRRALAGKV